MNTIRISLLFISCIYFSVNIKCKDFFNTGKAKHRKYRIRKKIMKNTRNVDAYLNAGYVYIVS